MKAKSVFRNITLDTNHSTKYKKLETKIST